MQQLRVLTWNIWFDRSTLEHRLPGILDTIEKHNPDIVSMQEVTNTSLIFLSQQLGRIGYRNTESDSDIRKKRGKGTGFCQGYGTVIFTKHELIDVKYIELQSQFGRILVQADIRLNSTPNLTDYSPSLEPPTTPTKTPSNNEVITILSSHLDSLGQADNVFHRKIQIDYICQLMRQIQSGSVIFTGDTNLMFDVEEETQAKYSHGDNAIVDVWASLRPDEEGYTYDYTRNGQIKDTYRTRLDRVYAKASNTWEFEQITMVGTEPFLGLRDAKMWPSDHFGLLCIFSKK